MSFTSRDAFFAERIFVCIGVFALLALCVVDSSSQARTRAVKRKPPGPAGKAANETPAGPARTDVERPVLEPKKNSRPAEAALEPTPSPSSERQRPAEYTYSFERPGFTYEKITIEHDDSGIGRITFKRAAFDEVVTDPVSLSKKTMEKLRGVFDALGFINSTENYQSARDYSHMGTIEVTLRRMGRERTARYNWTDNKNAKALMDEYRRIANEYTWRFEISLARENQPLEAPGLMDVLAGYLRRSEISDPKNLTPILTELASDERLPLIARNRAAELIKQIEKAK